MSDERLKRICDQAIVTAAECCQGAGAPLEMIIDRLLTYAAAQACYSTGDASTAQQFRAMADRIEAGAMDARAKLHS